jgi:hypothetical protein
MKSKDLEKRFGQMTEEQREAYRTKRSDSGLAQLLLGPLNEEGMKALNESEYHYQLNISNEIDEEIINQIADDEPVEEGHDFDGEGIEDLDGIDEDEAPAVVVDSEVEEVVDPSQMMEQQIQDPTQPLGQPGQPGVGDLGADVEEEEGYEDFFEDDEEVQASSEVIGNLLKLSQELDDEGKTAESLELLRLAKKFSGNLRKGK